MTHTLPKDKGHMTAVRLTSDEWRRVRIIAISAGVPVADLIADALRNTYDLRQEDSQ